MSSRVLARLAVVVVLAWAALLTPQPAVAAVPGVCPPPTVQAAPRLYGIDAYSNMYLFQADGAGHVTGGTLAWPAGGLWAGFKGIAVADYSGGGFPDVAGIDAHGDMRLFTGSASGSLSGGALMWTGGGLWSGFRNLVAGDFDGDHRQDLAGIDANGDLRLYHGDGAGHLVGGDLMWAGGRGVWAGFKRLAAADFTGDGQVDIVGIDAYGNLYLYRGDGAGGLLLSSGQPPWPTGGLWGGFRQVTGGDFTGDGYYDIAGVDAHGDLRLYAGDGTGHLVTSSGSLMWPGGGLWAGWHFLAAAASSPTALCAGGTRLAVMPLGDSITYGYSSASGSGYRSFLATLLNGRTPMGAGWLFEGSLDSGPPWWSHDGHGGWRIDTLDQNLGMYPTMPNGGVGINLVLLDAGSNDAGQGYTGATMLSRMSSLLDHLLALDPQARIEVAQLTINGQNAGAIQAEQDFNAGLPALVTGKGPTVVVVDMTGVHLSSDGVHPDDAGYSTMASRWFAAADAAGWLP